MLRDATICHIPQKLLELPPDQCRHGLPSTAKDMVAPSCLQVWPSQERVPSHMQRMPAGPTTHCHCQCHCHHAARTHTRHNYLPFTISGWWLKILQALVTGIPGQGTHSTAWFQELAPSLCMLCPHYLVLSTCSTPTKIRWGAKLYREIVKEGFS